MTPWPASVFEVDDPTTATGRRLAIPDGTLPVASEVTIDPRGWNRADGFSPSAPIIMSFRAGVSPLGLPPADNMDLSLSADSATVILDMTSGEHVAHFAVVDPNDEALRLYPAQRLAAGHRYAVAITDRVLARDGEPLDVPAGFAALRDGNLTDHHLLEAARPRLDDVLDALDDDGIDERDLLLAWDFTVASESTELAALRDRVLVTPSFDLTIDRSARQRDGMRRITGSLTAPLVAGGSHRITWHALVPPCAHPGIALYGHALLGDAREVETRGELAARSCRMLASVDLAGLSAHDEPALLRMVVALDDDAIFATLAQGVIDQLALAHALRSELATTTLAHIDSRDMIYIGASQFTGVLALAPVSRGVLSGDAPITSRVLDRYRALLALAYPQPLDATLVGVLAQMRWDAFELMPHQPVLLVGPADPATAWHARSLALPVVAPAPFTPWGVAVGNPDTGVGIANKIHGYAPCCDQPPCVLTCSALPPSP